nr:hypothetical protein CFP56_23858 [Quercus suber]
MIRHEEGIELGSLELLDKAFDMFEIEIGVRVRAGIPPGSGMQTDLHRPATEPSASVVMTGWVTTRSYRPHECGEVHLLGFRHILRPPLAHHKFTYDLLQSFAKAGCSCSHKCPPTSGCAYGSGGNRQISPRRPLGAVLPNCPLQQQKSRDSDYVDPSIVRI